MSRGLYDKYTVTKTDGSTIDPEAQYFVLRIDNDFDAFMAVLRWADEKGNDKLFEDLIDKIKEKYYN